jgi:PAS domain S-box-containing protein
MGKMDTRTGLPHSPDELGRLAQSFDDMASLLETRNIERERAEEALNQAYAEMEERVQERTAELTASNSTLMVEITERKQAEESLRDNEQFLTDIFNSIQDGMVILNPDFTIIRVNLALEKLPFVKPMAGIKCYEILHNRSEPCEECLTRQIIQTGQPAETILTIKADDGSTVFVEIHAFPLLNRTTGQVDQVIEFMRNITGRKRAEEERLRFSKLESLSTLAGGIAHDFNNILTAILGNVGLAMLDGKIEPKVQNRLAQAEQACLKAQNLSRQLLTFAKGGAPIKKIKRLLP